jgi:hypothetical protein
VYGGDSGAGARDENELVLKKAALRKPRLRVIKGDELLSLRSAPNRREPHTTLRLRQPSAADPHRAIRGDLGANTLLRLGGLTTR